MDPDVTKWMPLAAIILSASIAVGGWLYAARRSPRDELLQDLDILGKLPEGRPRDALELSIRYRTAWLSVTSMKRRDSTQIGLGGGLLFIGAGFLMFDFQVTKFVGQWILVPIGFVLFLSGTSRSYRKDAKDQLTTLRAAADAVARPQPPESPAPPSGPGPSGSPE